MRTLKYNGEQWHVDERSLWKRCRQWLIWIGGWEKPNGEGWQFLIDYGHKKGLMSPAPVSVFGHFFTYFSWGWQLKLAKLYPSKIHRYLVWSESGLYISSDGTPPRSGKEHTRGFYIIKGRHRRRDKFNHP